MGWQALGGYHASGLTYGSAAMVYEISGTEQQYKCFVYKMGGSKKHDQEATNHAYKIDLTGTFPTWQSIAPMHRARRNFNLVILPDGTLLVVGGNKHHNYTYPVFDPEIYDPKTNTWTVMAEHDRRVPRWYHSVACLLPDGRVILMGGDFEPDRHNYEDYRDQNNKSFQIFTPPYLENVFQPTIVSAPSALTYGSEFAVGALLPEGKELETACLIKLASTTHGFDQNQRYVPLKKVVGTSQFIAPSHANIAPPGHYLLFVLYNAGTEQNPKLVPSRAKTVRLGY
jgi:hypothetical protein